MGVGQRGEGERGEDETGDGNGRRHRDEPAVAGVVPDQRQDGVDDRQRQRQHEAEMAGLDDHRLSFP